MPAQILFLPGASGRTQVWKPVAGLLSHPAPKVHLGWPGHGAMPPDPGIGSLDDVVCRVAANVKRPSALIAQSMGGVIAIRVALKKPELVTHLVLAATSGGMDVAALGGADWRPSLAAAHPTLPRWFLDYDEDLSPKLPAVQVPTLLLWGDSDPLSPFRVGERLAALLPRARLHVVAGADHDLAETHAAEIAPLIDALLSPAA